MWVEFVVGSLPCLERLFSVYSGFCLTLKGNISKFQFDQESGTSQTKKPPNGYATSKLLFNLYLLLNLNKSDVWLMKDKSEIYLFIIRNQQLLTNSSPQAVAHSKCNT